MFVYTISEMNMKNKRYFESPVYQNVSLILEALQYNLPTSLPLFLLCQKYLILSFLKSSLSLKFSPKFHFLQEDFPDYLISPLTFYSAR